MFFVAENVISYEEFTEEICSNEFSKIILRADYSVCNFEASIHEYGAAQPKSGPHHSQLENTLGGRKIQGFYGSSSFRVEFACEPMPVYAR